MELKTPTVVTLDHLNVRHELHGKERKDAYDIDMSIEGANHVILGMLAPGLCEALYFNSKATEDKPNLPGVEQVLQDLRFPGLGLLTWVDKIEGADFWMEYGTARKESNIELPGGKFQTKKVENKAGGTSVLSVQFSTSNMPDGVLDKLRKKLKQKITVTVIQSEEARNGEQQQPLVPPAPPSGKAAAAQKTPEQALAESAAS